MKVTDYLSGVQESLVGKEFYYDEISANICIRNNQRRPK